MFAINFQKPNELITNLLLYFVHKKKFYAEIAGILNNLKR